jgi:hypothetical protein
MMKLANPREGSTWAGAVGAITAVLSAIFPDSSDMIASIGAGLASLLLAILPTHMGEKK